MSARSSSVALLVVTLAAPLAVLAAPPLTIKEQGSFFVGGEKKTVASPAVGPIPAQSGEITVNQMYVQYQIPMKGDTHVLVVMVHGCCLSSKTWETTPDGRMGWSEYFVRKDRPVYLADQVSRARSGFDPGAFSEACETLSLCYWADNGFEVDFFGYGQKLETGALPLSSCEKVFLAPQMRLVQIDKYRGEPASMRLPRACNEFIQSHYTVLLDTELYVLFARRGV